MIRNSLILVASFGLLAGCASSSANNPPPQDPDAGKVSYDVGGQPNSGGSAGQTDPAGGDTVADAPKGRDSTSTMGGGFKPRAVKKIAASKPAKPEPATDTKAPPTRTPRKDPNGLLVEAFTIPAATDKLPADYTSIKLTNIFVTSTVDASTTGPLAGAPATLKAPTALRFTGSLNVTAANEYQLCTKSSDGSQLLIEENLVVDNDGLHAQPAEKCELVALEPGEYKLEIRSFHVTGPIMIQASWAVGKDGTPAPFPKTSLFKPEGADDRVRAKK
jgi:hypothetical protein